MWGNVARNIFPDAVYFGFNPRKIGIGFFELCNRFYGNILGKGIGNCVGIIGHQHGQSYSHDGSLCLVVIFRKVILFHHSVPAVLSRCIVGKAELGTHCAGGNTLVVLKFIRSGFGQRTFVLPLLPRGCQKFCKGDYGVVKLGVLKIKPIEHYVIAVLVLHKRAAVSVVNFSAGGVNCCVGGNIGD